MAHLHLTLVVISLAGCRWCIIMFGAGGAVVIATWTLAGHSWIIVYCTSFGASSAVFSTFIWVVQALRARVVLQATLGTWRCTVIVVFLVIRTGAAKKIIKLIDKLIHIYLKKNLLAGANQGGIETRWRWCIKHRWTFAIRYFRVAIISAFAHRTLDRILTRLHNPWIPSLVASGGKDERELNLKH